MKSPLFASLLIWVNIGRLADSSPIELVESLYKLAILCFRLLREPCLFLLFDVPLPLVDLSRLLFISEWFRYSPPPCTTYAASR